MKQLKGKSMNIVNDNIEKLKELFPEVFSKGKIDFAKLQEELGLFKSNENKRYNFTNIKEERSNEDLLYEILLKYGLDLTLPIEELNINGKKIFSIGYGSLVCCLDSDINSATVQKIAELKKQFQDDYGLENMRVVFKDSSFKDSVVKTNALQILKQHGIDEVVSV